ncbi:M48 family metallopeptidase [Opitutus sp. ER46]|uniref:M48 family metallopeptidase n=1 Tax=Opitutus sp. ER46 TaxID=2161864 RepID=UPI001304D674|nr:M48 family metallopeptidase [Opitutus sp. ER46]
MDFFEAQARARKRSSRLVLLFILAVLGTIAAMYVATWFILGQTIGHPHTYSTRGYEVSFSRQASFWQPQLFVGVSLATLAVVGLGSLFKWSQFSAGGRAVAESVGGRRIDSATTDLNERRLLNVVEEMAIASGVPVPAVYILDEEPAINAFAAGLTTSDAVVAVTRGTLEKLNRDELQGVVGHEFSHILNGDMRLNLRIAAIIFGILVLGVIGRGVLWSMRGNRPSRGKNNNGAAVVLALGLALLIIGYVGYFFGRLIQAAVSRQREFLADASAVQFTRNPAGITGALKKIGGYALGSSVQANGSAAIGHFFFAQAFRSNFGGLWATHPPLDERIRAIDASFDGKFFEPPKVVDVGRESFVTAGLAPAARSAVPPPLTPANTLAAVGAIGTLSPEHLSGARDLLERTPERLRSAAHSPAEARVLLYGLLLSDQPAIRTTQLAVIDQRAGPDARRLLEELDPALRQVEDAHRLPLLQIALPALRQTPAPDLDTFLGTLDELVHADHEVTAFEYAMQRLLTQTLALGRKPADAVTQIYSFNAVTREIAVVLSVLARASTQDPAAAAQAFAVGAAQLKLIQASLAFLPADAATLREFDAALDKLAGASLPIKQRTLAAAAHVVQADGQVRICEFELLRAIAAAFSVPMPPLA